MHVLAAMRVTGKARVNQMPDAAVAAFSTLRRRSRQFRQHSRALYAPNGDPR
jgi:hypothetical protein